MIDIRDLSFSYAAHRKGCHVLRNVNLRIRKGERVGLLGSTGCGKTTLLRCMNSIIPNALKGIMRGDVRVDGWNTREHNLAEFATKTGYVFQNPDDQLVTHTVFDELCFGPRNLGILDLQVVNDVAKNLGMETLLNRSVQSLSGGQKQKVALASVLTMKPKVLLFDEPLSSLDSHSMKSFLGMISSLPHDNTIVIAEHNSWLLAPVLTRVIVMNQGGGVAIDGSPAEVFAEVDELKHLGIEPDPRVEAFRMVSLKRQRGEGSAW